MASTGERQAVPQNLGGSPVNVERSFHVVVPCPGHTKVERRALRVRRNASTLRASSP
jgi:hypothetical protein